MQTKDKGLSLFELISLVVGSIIGAGVFNLPHDVAQGAGPGAVIIGWIIVSIGMISLGLSFQNLTVKQPDLDTGIYSYAQAGFGKYMGFNAAWGYWLSTLMGNVSYASLVMSAVGYFLPVFKGGQNIWSIIAASCILWGCHWMVLRGIKTATVINTIITVAKLIPILLSVIILILSFKLHIFTLDFWNTANGHFQFSSVFQQVRSMMLVSVWVFTGIEGAVIFSGGAKKRSDVGKATILGVLTIILIYTLITLLSFGVMSRYHLAHLTQPAMGTLLESIVGKWGAAVINLGLIIAVSGAWLSWTMFSSQVPHAAAKAGTFPHFFAQENKAGAPTHALIVTNCLVEFFILSFIVTPKAYNTFFSMASSAMLIPYTCSAFYQFKYTLMDDRYSIKNWVIGILASVYTMWLICSDGWHYLALISVIFAMGVPAYCYLQRHDNHQQRIFTKPELCLAGIILLAGISTGWQLF